VGQVKLSTILIIILMLDIFCYYGVQVHDSITGAITPDEIGNRPFTMFMEENITTGELSNNVNQTILSSFTEWTSSIGMAILSATGQMNVARDIMGAISLVFSLLLAPFAMAKVLGLSEMWMLGPVLSLVYTLLIAVGGLAAIRGGEV